MPKRVSRTTRTVRAGVSVDQEYGAVMPPLYLSSTFAFERFGVKGRYDYTRSGNPTRDLLSAALADIEGGTSAVVTSSGMAAITAVVQLVRPGERLVAPHDCYGGTFRLLKAFADRGAFELDLVDLTDPESRSAALASPARMLLIETPSNPLLRITDIRVAAAEAKAAGAIVVADNTFLSPAFQRPIELGADVVVHSTTKYLNGHSDIVGGAIITREAALGEELDWWVNCLGVSGAPFDSYLTLRGLRTLHVRAERHLANTGEVVACLEAHEQVGRVYYPGLVNHPNHAVATAQQDGFGAMVSFELADQEAVETFVEALRVFTLAESLGGVESLVSHPATMTHASMTPEARETAGITEGLVRLSVGIEHTEDLLQDIEQALQAVEARIAAGPLSVAL